MQIRHATVHGKILRLESPWLLMLWLDIHLILSISCLDASNSKSFTWHEYFYEL